MDYIIIFVFLSCFTFGSQIALVILFAEIYKKLKLMDSIQTLESNYRTISEGIEDMQSDLKKLEYSYFSKLQEYNTLCSELNLIKSCKKRKKS